MKEGQTANQPFPPTRWSLVARASGSESGTQGAALEELCQLYWPPIYAFIRSRGVSAEEAEDTTQAFFADFLSRSDFEKADVERGTLRTFLLRAVSNFMARDRRDRSRQKRGDGATVLSLDISHEDGSEALIEPVDGATPEIMYQRQWVLTLLNHVVSDLQTDYEKRNQGGLFQALRFVIVPGLPSVAYSEIASTEGMTETAVKVAAHRLRERYGQRLRSTVADTLEEGEDVEEELRQLMAVFS